MRVVIPWITLLVTFWGWSAAQAQPDSSGCYVLEQDFLISTEFFGKLENIYREYTASHNQVDVLIVELFSGGHSKDYDFALRFSQNTDAAELSLIQAGKTKSIQLEADQLATIAKAVESINIGSFDQLKVNSISGNTKLVLIKKEGKIVYKHLFENGSVYQCLSSADLQPFESTKDMVLMLYASSGKTYD